MALLIIQEPGQPSRRFQIKGQDFTIGRNKDCGLVLPNTTVSRLHAKIIRTDKNNAQIKNLSDNTLLVNKVAVTESPLNTRDVIQIGRFTLIYFGDNLTPVDQFYEGKGLDEYPLFARTAQAQSQGDTTFTMSAADAKKLLASNNLLRSAKIFTLDRKLDWSPGKGPLTFGKGGSIAVEGWFTGGIIAEITWNGAQHLIEKKGGFAKVLLNDAKVTAPTILRDGDRIQVGASFFMYNTES